MKLMLYKSNHTKLINRRNIWLPNIKYNFVKNGSAKTQVLLNKVTEENVVVSKILLLVVNIKPLSSYNIRYYIWKQFINFIGKCVIYMYGS